MCLKGLLTPMCCEPGSCSDSKPELAIPRRPAWLQSPHLVPSPLHPPPSTPMMFLGILPLAFLSPSTRAPMTLLAFVCRQFLYLDVHPDPLH